VTEHSWECFVHLCDSKIDTYFFSYKMYFVCFEVDSFSLSKAHLYKGKLELDSSMEEIIKKCINAYITH